MLSKFTIAKVQKTEREYEYHDYPFRGEPKKAIEYIYELTAEDGERYFLFHQRKTDSQLRQYKNMYVDARKMESKDGTKYSAPHEGAYNVRRLYTKDQFDEEVRTRKEVLEKQQNTNAAELIRLAALEAKG